jgi:hypothetical protein
MNSHKSLSLNANASIPRNADGRSHDTDSSDLQFEKHDSNMTNTNAGMMRLVMFVQDKAFASILRKYDCD